jgi:hypothetical protein
MAVVVYNWDKLQLEAFYGHSSDLFRLTPREIKLLLVSLGGATDRHNWIDDEGNNLSDDDWNDADAFTSSLIGSLMEPFMTLQFIVHLAGTQAIPGPASDTQLQFSVREFDPSNQFDTSAYKWVVPETALYRVGAWVQIWNMGTDPSWARVRCTQNGVYILNGGNQGRRSDTQFVHADFELPAFLTEGDEIKFFAAHNDSVTRNTATFNRTQRAWAYKVGA